MKAVIRLHDETGTLLLEQETSAGMAGGPALPCFRCGICCERWQPLLTAADAGQLAAALGLDLPAFHAAYTSPYPFSDEERLLRRGADGACIFLRWEGEPHPPAPSHAGREQDVRGRESFPPSESEGEQAQGSCSAPSFPHDLSTAKGDPADQRALGGEVRRAGCAVHAARPAVCREWAAGLDKKECLQGLARFSSDGVSVALPVLYPLAAERAAAAAALTSHRNSR